MRMMKELPSFVDRRPAAAWRSSRSLRLAVFLPVLALSPPLDIIGAALPAKRSPVASQTTYRNPLLAGQQMADPDVIRVNGKYYLYATTHTKGYDVFVSDDLVNWKNEGSAFDD